MPVYLCQAGTETDDPWRHGLQVFGEPFMIEENDSNNESGEETVTNLIIADWKSPSEVMKVADVSETPVRRLKHSEVVVADDICIAFERYWLRLKWPGSKGGFAGYVAMGKASELHNSKESISIQEYEKVLGAAESLRDDDREGSEETDVDEPMQEEHSDSEQFDAEPVTCRAAVKCLRTGLDFATSPTLKLMPAYDDGLNPSVSLTPFQNENVFCRICREGLHDDDGDEQPAPEGAEDGVTGMIAQARQDDDEEEVDTEPVAVDPVSNVVSHGPVSPPLKYQANHNVQDNPLLSPCECAGSMAFVHYLCVEQWRCRSRHPEAKNGLNCETCGKPYALPPPASRPTAEAYHEDWVEAMPAHVMQALRQPHFFWQLGMALVRQRYLRPLAPVFMSPIVALYCRARRLLKKRGVARRRWACSLCRRRARWKCVRCLRSYYCSRPCQNVSWHIVHKHVCYKPSRMGWSIVVYGAALLACFPGILRDPLMYDLGLCFFPIVSFYVLAVLGGGIASCFKSFMGVDLRGRIMEAIIVTATIWLSVVLWKLVQGFFGDAPSCWGVAGAYTLSKEELSSTFVLRAVHKLILSPAEFVYLATDKAAQNSGSWLRAALCTSHEWTSETTKGSAGCFERLPHSNADFFFDENGGASCAGDVLLVGWLYVAAGFALVGTHYLKQHERERRRLGRRRVHQD